VQLDRALYGTIQAARCWYDLLSGELKGWAFTPNRYDPCVFNKDMGGLNHHQCTIVLHVDDMMVTCRDGIVGSIECVVANLCVSLRLTKLSVCLLIRVSRVLL